MSALLELFDWDEEALNVFLNEFQSVIMSLDDKDAADYQTLEDVFFKKKFKSITQAKISKFIVILEDSITNIQKRGIINET